MTIDVVAGDALMNKPYPEAYALIDDMAQNHYQWGMERASVEREETKGGIYEVSYLDHMSAKIDAIAQKVNSLTINPTATAAAIQPGCEIYGTQGHTIAECNLLADTNSNQVNYAQGNPYFNTYNPG